MQIKVPKNATVNTELTYTGDVYITMSDDVARLVHDRMEKRYFQEDFLNFLQVQNEEFEFCNGDKKAIWDKLWESYQKYQDMNIAAWDTFETVLQEVWEDCGEFTCQLCGKKLLSSIPVTDSNGNCYCDHCGNNKTDFCENCGERHLKSELTYVEGGVGYCDKCKEERIND